jgi:hypothetical protein
VVTKNGAPRTGRVAAISGDQTLLHLLFPQLKGLHLEEVVDLGESVRITARTGTWPVACHGCGTPSVRVHGDVQDAFATRP